jgi:hypothetical protein
MSLVGIVRYLEIGCWPLSIPPEGEWSLLIFGVVPFGL